LSRKEGHVGAVAFSRTGGSATGDCTINVISQIIKYTVTVISEYFGIQKPLVLLGFLRRRVGDPSRTNIQLEINLLHWLTGLKMAIGRNTLFQVLAHPKNRSCNATMACGLLAGLMTRTARSKGANSLS
jgi:hypothetical protein